MLGVQGKDRGFGQIIPEGSAWPVMFVGCNSSKDAKTAKKVCQDVTGPSSLGEVSCSPAQGPPCIACWYPVLCTRRWKPDAPSEPGAAEIWRLWLVQRRGRLPSVEITLLLIDPLTDSPSSVGQPECPWEVSSRNLVLPERCTVHIRVQCNATRTHAGTSVIRNQAQNSTLPWKFNESLRKYNEIMKYNEIYR